MQITPLGGICLGSGLFFLLGLGFALIRAGRAMRSYIVTRTLLTIPMVFILSSLVFFVMHILPGDPIRSSLGPRGSEEQVQAMREELGLNRPIVVQYAGYLGSVARLDLGNSLIYGNRPVIDEISERFPATLELTMPSMAVALGFGILAGVWAGNKRKTAADYGLRLFSIGVYSIPIFWMGLMLQYIFSLQLAILPVAGRVDSSVAIGLERTTNILIIDSIISGNLPALFSVLKHLILPSVTLGMALTGVFVRLTRINMIEALQEDYITAARARGIHERVIVFSHALRNAFIPVLTVIGLYFAILLAGAVLTETTFSWPGIGQYLVEHILLRDYTAVQGVITVFVIYVAGITLAIDIVYAFIDPRIRF